MKIKITFQLCLLLSLSLLCNANILRVAEIPDVVGIAMDVSEDSSQELWKAAQIQKAHVNGVQIANRGEVLDSVYGYGRNSNIVDHRYYMTYDYINRTILYENFDLIDMSWWLTGQFMVDYFDSLGHLIRREESSYTKVLFRVTDWFFDNTGMLTSKEQIQDNYKFEWSYNSDGNETLYNIYTLVGGVWIPSRRHVSRYAANGNLQEILVTEYNGSWKNVNKTSFTYSMNQELILKEEFVWSATDSAWVNNKKEEQIFDSNGECIEQLSYMWVNSVWVNDRKKEWVYALTGELILYEEHVWYNSVWRKDKKIIYEYNAQGYVYKEYHFKNNSRDEGWLNEMIQTYTYNYAGQLLLIEYDTWEGGEWVRSIETMRQYNDLGNIILWQEDRAVYGNPITFAAKSIYFYSTPKQREEITICEGELPYQWRDKVCNAFGDYTTVLSGVYDYDLTYCLTLNVNSEYYFTDTLILTSEDFPFSYLDTVFDEQTPLGVKTYIFNFKTIDGCDSIHSVTLDVQPVGIASLNSDVTIDIYPNPVAKGESIILELPIDIMESVHVELFNSVGECVKQYYSAGNRLVVEGLHVSGIYIVRITTQSHKGWYGKVVVK